MSADRVPLPPHVFRLSSRSLPMLLTLIVLSLLAIHLVLQSDRFGADRVPWELQQLFDLDEEQSVPNAYSALALALAAALAGAISVAARGTSPSHAGRWRAMGWILFYLSFDEVAGIHETVNSLSPVSWAIPFGLLALVVGAWMWPFASRLPQATRWGIIVSGVIYVAGAVGVELVTGHFFDESNKRQISYAFNTVIEEGLEMFGVVVLIRTLLRHMEQTEQAAGVAAVAIKT